MQRASSSFPAAILSILFVILAATVSAQDPVKVAPDNYKVTTNNTRVRVVDIHLKPGDKVPMHSHPGYVAVALTPCKVRFTSPAGKTQDVEFKAGDANWRDAETHAVQNIGESECHVLNIELKSGRKAK
ncbi:MAG: cytoplasmic protein [Acidobacteriota bacterium]|nr:cytoplasmic protein [Acidobacteriota bacterium]